MKGLFGVLSFFKKYDLSSARETDRRVADAYLAKGDLQAAIKHYKATLAEHPKEAKVYGALGLAQKMQGNLIEAKESFEQAIQLDEGLALAHYYIGTINQAEGKLVEAKADFNKALQLDPSLQLVYPDLCHILYLNKEYEQAKQAAMDGLAIDPEFALLHNYLGNLYYHEGEAAKAISSYEKALVIKPEFAEAHYNLGMVFDGEGNFDEAITSFCKALILNPQYLDAHLALGKIYFNQNKPKKVLYSYLSALKINSDLPEIHHIVGNIFLNQGQHDQAIYHYKQAVSLQPGKKGLLHLIAALQGETPEKSSREYVEKLFDEFANDFDTKLVQKLDYQTPQKLVSVVRKASELPEAGWEVLDLGCGTGLAGLELATCAKRIVGVDLSQNMLKKAAELNIYQRLEHSDLLVAMQNESTASYDLIIAADVFVYLGKLDEIFSEARRLLRPNGVFAFSVEALLASGKTVEKKDYQLNNTGRYTHSDLYLDDLAAKYHFKKLHMDLSQIRTDKGKPVEGWLSLWKAN